MKIGIAISSYNRPELLFDTVQYHKQFLPEGAEILIVQDRDEKRMGIPRIKNLCLKLLEAKGVTDYFLFDDDAWPIAKDWWRPYVESKEPHLMYQFRLPGKPEKDMRELWRGDDLVAYSHTRGAMIYVNQSVLDTVGGMDTAYGLGVFEHPDWSNRIHNAGLTSFRAMDVVGSDKLIYCLDQDEYIKSSIPDSVKRDQTRKNFKLYQASKTSKEYKEFR